MVLRVEVFASLSRNQIQTLFLAKGSLPFNQQNSEIHNHGLKAKNRKTNATLINHGQIACTTRQLVNF